MIKMRLSKRLKAITEFVDKEDRIIDIGCDHALLDIYIKENIKNRKIIASDIHEGAIKQAKKNIEKYSMERKISLRLGDGLDVIKEGEVDTIIIAGMGYNNIEKILSNSEKLKDINKIIVQSNTDVVKLRKSVIKLGFKITREKGFNKVSNREIAKELNCSIRPIYYQFKNASELNVYLFKKVENYFYNYLTKDIKIKDKLYLSTGINYINFAKYENNLFKLMYMYEGGKKTNEIISENDKESTNYNEIVMKSTSLTKEKAKDFHLKMWIFTHGLASLVSMGSVNFTEEEIVNLLRVEYKALMLEEKDGKK